MENFKVQIYPSTDGTFLVTFIHPLTNARIRERFSRQSEATTYKQSIEQKFGRAEKETYNGLTIDELIILMQNEKPNEYFSASKTHVRDFIDTFGKSVVTELSTLEIRTWMDAVKSENNLEKISVRGLKCILEILFRFAVEKELISESPLKPILFKKYTPNINSRNILTPAQIKDLLEKAKEHSPGYLYPILLMFAETAAKPADVVDLIWKQVDLEKRTVHFLEGDKCQDRVLDISEELTDLLSKKKKAFGPVFMTYYKEPFTKYKISALVNAFKAKGNCDLKWTPSDLRHSFAVNFLSSGGNIRRLQYILGHASIHETRRLYGEAAVEQVSKIASSPFEVGSLDVN